MQISQKFNDHFSELQTVWAYYSHLCGIINEPS